MKILIFYASYGGGHLNAAKSIKDCINIKNILDRYLYPNINTYHPSCRLSITVMFRLHILHKTFHNIVLLSYMDILCNVLHHNYSIGSILLLSYTRPNVNSTFLLPPFLMWYNHFSTCDLIIPHNVFFVKSLK